MQPAVFDRAYKIVSTVPVRKKNERAHTLRVQNLQPQNERPQSLRIRTYTYSDCLAWPEDFRAEIIDGEIFVMPSPTRNHQKIIFNLCGLFYLLLRNNPEWEAYTAPLDVRLWPMPDNSDENVFEPDLVVVRRGIEGQKSIEGVPELLVEVLSPSTVVYDKGIKKQHYQAAGVKEYWIVDGDNKTIEVNVLENGVYTQAVYAADSESGKALPVRILPGCQININDIFMA